ncbi:MAG: aconitase X catalytic domain-containing protein [Candidatus Hydrothermarchaeales archaeon]
MHLTREEEGILRGEGGEGKRKAMEILVALGDIHDADRLIDVSSVQVSGVSYKTIGDAGLEFLKDFASTGVKVEVLTTLNPMGVDLESWDELGFSEAFVERQKEIIEAYTNMDILPSCTCAPYLLGNLPKFGKSISWAESSSAIFANSVIGARTNRESGISALASAIMGKTPRWGLHLDENRRGTFIVDVQTEMSSPSDYAALGYNIGKNFDGIPVFRSIRPSLDDMKALGAALATGTIEMFHVEGVTPECSALIEEGELERTKFGDEELEDTYETLNTTEDPDLICIGCPHCSIEEIRKVIEANPERETWIFTPKENKALMQKYVKNENIKIVSDTCMVVSPLEDIGIKSIGTNSAKCAFYSLNLSGLGVKFDRMENLIK